MSNKNTQVRNKNLPIRNEIIKLLEEYWEGYKDKSDDYTTSILKVVEKHMEDLQ